MYIYDIGAVIILIRLTSILQSAYNRIQEMNHELLDRHLLSNNEVEKSQLMNVYQRGKSLSFLSACGFFGISKSSLTSMLSVR